MQIKTNSDKYIFIYMYIVEERERERWDRHCVVCLAVDSGHQSKEK